MTSSKNAVVLVVITFLVIAVICSSCTKLNVFALKRGPVSCKAPTGIDYYRTVECCQDETDNKGVTITWCTICANTQPPSDCGPRYQNKENPPVPPKLPPPVVNTEPPSVSPSNNTSPTTTGVIEQPPTNMAPPKVCPDGSSPDANGNCPPTTQAPTDQGTTLPPEHHKGSNLGKLGGSLLNDNNNNNPSPSTSTGDNSSKHNKDSDLLRSTAPTGDNNNNKPSKHHKGSDNLTPPPLTTDQGTTQSPS